MDNQRKQIRSPIPSSPNLSQRLPRRPMVSGEDRDQSIRLYTNHFECSIEEDVTFHGHTLQVEKLDEKDKWIPIGDPLKRNGVARRLLPNDRLEGSELVWYDLNENHLYSRLSIEVPKYVLSTDNRTRLTITEPVAEFSTNEIHRYINGDQDIYPSEVVHVLETLLKQALGERVQIMGNKYFFSDQSTQPSRGGLNPREGFVGSLHLYSGLITWNVERKNTYFYASVLLPEFIRQELNSDRRPSQGELETIGQKLNGCKIVVIQRMTACVYRFHRFDTRRADAITNWDGDTVENFYREMTGLPLAYPDNPCVEAYPVASSEDRNRPCYIPMELCRIEDSQIYTKNVNRHSSPI